MNNLSSDVVKHIFGFLEPKGAHRFSLTSKRNALCAKYHFKHPFRKGSLVYVNRFGLWTDLYRVVEANEDVCYLQKVTWRHSAKMLYDNGTHSLWKPLRYTEDNAVLWRPQRYLNMFSKYAFCAKGALKHGEFILRPTDSADASMGRLLMD